MSKGQVRERGYSPWRIEERWRERWAEEGIYRTPVAGPDQDTFYCLDFFPYPSGAGLSVGHGRNYVPSDVVARYHRMRGAAVLHPMGWDAFGLPAENEAMRKGVHPADSTAQYAANYRRQLTLLGCSYGWEREINSSDPAYYRWNQAFFLRLYRRGLAYRGEAPVNWCETCQTVLAAEEIEKGRCWRCHHPVVRRPRKQWYIRTTAYAEELYDDLEMLDWPEHILTMQRHWIGKQAGVEVDLPVVGPAGVTITVFTTRPDTLFGVTFIAVAPEHPLLAAIASSEQWHAVEAYRARAAQRTDLERRSHEPDGVFVGAHARLPTGQSVPIYVADYVLPDYGTGAVMGVPAHDSRDGAFAERHHLPVRRVIVSSVGADDTLPFVEPGVLIDSDRFSGLTSEAAQAAIPDWLEDHGGGRPTVIYRLRDWLISRQRYWGTPIPIVHCPDCGEVAVPEADLPVLLPPLPDYRPRGDGRSPLANVPAFVKTRCPTCGGPAERETDTMTGFVCSSWYYLRFVDPHNARQPFDPQKAAKWLPVDLYIGGGEHAVGHLLYARFWTKFLADEGLIAFREPFPVLRSQGVLHVRDPVSGGVERMSKSKGNVVTPDSVIERYGADITRLHLLFMGPFEANTVWEVEDDGTTPQHIEGVRRFVHRVWALSEGRETAVVSEADSEREIARVAHRAARAVTEQLEIMHFNTAISALMALVGELEQHRRAHGDTPAFITGRLTLLKLLAPFAPFVTEELWDRIGQRAKVGSIHHAAWPEWDPVLVRREEVEIAVQVDGKIRDRIAVDADAGETKIRELAIATPRVQEALDGMGVGRVIVVPGRLVNIVTQKQG
ncbi:MAG: leucine--tRNA ligase [Anaerolineae bacterium]